VKELGVNIWSYCARLIRRAPVLAESERWDPGTTWLEVYAESFNSFAASGQGRCSRIAYNSLRVHVKKILRR